MLLEKISEKNNIINCSHSNNVSPKIGNGKFNVKEDGEFLWEFNEQVDGEVWMQVNFIEPTPVFEIDWHIKNVYDGNNNLITVHNFKRCEHSLDGINWYVLEKDPINGYSGYTDLNPIFIRLVFDHIMPGFSMDRFRVFGEEKYEFKKELISITAKKYYPQRYFEKFPLIPNLVKNFLEMLECNKYDKTIKKFFDNDTCLVDVYLIFDEGDDGSGAINSYPINTVPINSGSATLYNGLGAVVINRIAGGGAFYSLTGRITDPLGNNSSLGLRFNSTVECDPCPGLHLGHPDCRASENAINKKLENANYSWSFDDAFAQNVSNNPTILSVESYGEVIHNFTMLGTYNVKFVMDLGGALIIGSQFIELAPSPYVITGDYRATDGTIYTINGLTLWPNGSYQAPTIQKHDPNLTDSSAELIDNGDRTFTVVSNGENGPCIVRIWDEYYEQWSNLDITFEPAVPANALLDSNEDPILDSSENYITTN